MATPTVIPGVAPSLIANPDLCTLQTCPLELAHVLYIPSLAGNALYIAIFGLVLITQLFLGIRYRIWGFLVAMLGGLILEIIGYYARVKLHDNPFSKNAFLMYLVCLTIGPAFLSAAVYLCLSRIVVAYSQAISYFQPKTYTLVFITCDFVALLLQAAGGAIASTANTPHMDTLGKNIMVAGVSWQVVSLVVFAVLCAEYASRVRKATELNSRFASLRSTRYFRYFLWGLGFATLAIFIRSVFRCAELSQGFKGKLANQQITFMILEGAMICSAVILLTVFHPGLAFRGMWEEAGWKLIKTKEKEGIEMLVTDKTGSTTVTRPGEAPPYTAHSSTSV